MEEKKKIRCYGIDLLKIIVMYFVVILHICNFGGVEAAVTNIQQYAVSCFYKSITCSAVNVFAIISGYIGYGNKRFKLSRLIELWSMIVFYCVIISGIMCYIFPERVGVKDIIKSFMPITLNYYWYFSAYVGLFFFMPLINKIVEVLEKENFIKTCVLAGFVFSFYGVVGSYFNDPFTLKSGYSCLWLGILYYLGAGIKKHNIGNRLTTKSIIIKIFIIWGVDVLISVMLKFITLISGCTFSENLIEYLFMSYISPAVLILSVLFVIFFSRLKLEQLNKHVLKTCSSAAFGVYIIHTNPLIWEYCFKDSFQFITQYSLMGMIISIPIVALLLFICCMIVDIVRGKIFTAINVRLLGDNIEHIIKNSFNKLMKTIIRHYNL